MKKLITSYKFWTAFAGAVGLLLTAISEHIGIEINADGVKEIIMSFCGVLIVFGVVKKPTQKQEISTPQEIVLDEKTNINISENSTNICDKKHEETEQNSSNLENTKNN